MKPGSNEVEESMRCFYNSLNEKDRRRYAGVEALKFGHGGRVYIAKLLGCSRNTVSKGASEMSGLSKRKVDEMIRGEKPRVRKSGGGRKPYQASLGLRFLKNFWKYCIITL